MSIAKKLVLTVALTLAATAVASASAYASATITPTGTYIATQNAPGTLVSDDLGATITCDTSRFTGVTGTGVAPSTATAQTLAITGLTFTACTANFGGSCTVTVDSLPAKVTVNKDTFTTGVGETVPTWTAVAVVESATVLCGANVVHCDVSVDTTLTGTWDASDESGGTFDILNEPVDIADGTSIACGTTATWTVSWTITTPDSYLITP